MNDHSIKDFKLVGIELLQAFFYKVLQFVFSSFHSDVLSGDRDRSILSFLYHSINLAIIYIKNIKVSGQGYKKVLGRGFEKKYRGKK